jgi:membrane associated rhomboid family serine protease
MITTFSFLRSVALSLTFGLLGSFTTLAKADTTTEERFQDLFVTAGYSAAFGAAMGAAFLAFEPNPSEKLQYISIGASLGFIGGSVAGTYIIFQPMFGENSDDPAVTNLVARHDRQGTLLLRPQFDMKSREVNHVEGVYTLLTF